MKSEKVIQIFDGTIVFFISLFLASLTNSIFVNQLGYYGALLFILGRYFYTKKNPFFKTGLEIAFLLFITAEIISTIFAVNQPQSFNNLLKRLFILPTVYTVAVVAFDIKRLKYIFKMYMAFALISCLIYLYMSMDYWFYGLFAIKGSGPSVFQFPITASELISFTIVFLFAFIINEKQSWKFKLFNIFAFVIASVALVSTYKRTGWIGTAAGILAVLIAKKQWKLLLFGFVLIIAAVFMEKNESKVFIYPVDNIEKSDTIIETEGFAKNVYSENDTLYVSDYDNGLLLYCDSEIIDRIEFPGAVTDFQKWIGNYYFAYLTDTRFILFKKDSQNKLLYLNEFISPGYVETYQVNNGYLYISDLDSGLTVFKNPEDISDYERFPSITKNNFMCVEDSTMFLYSREEGIKIYSLENRLPASEIESYTTIENFISIDYINGNIFVSDKNGSRFFKLSNSTLTEISDNDDLKSIYNVVPTLQPNKFLFAGYDKNIYSVEIDSAMLMTVTSKIECDYLATTLIYTDDHIITSYMHQGRLSSIFDLNKPNNFNRLAFWRAGLLMLKDNPIFGVGDIDLADLYRKYKRPFDKEIQGHLHNNYFHLLAILGVFGFIVVMYMFTKIFLLNNKIYSEVKEIPFASSYALGTIGVFFAFLISGLTEWNFGDHEIITMLWFVIGLNLANRKLNSKENFE